VRYFVTVLDREFEVEVDGDRVAVGGRSVPASLGAVPGTPVRELRLDGHSEAIALEAGGAGHWALVRRGERIELEVLDERARHIRRLTGATARARGPAVIKAPMPGLVVRIQVEAGQSVASGAGVVVLEAMKMENELRAAAPGVVAAVRVRPGEAVEKGQVLVEFAAGT
jgi:pyruvate carboxylase subunit B